MIYSTSFHWLYEHKIRYSMQRECEKYSGELHLVLDIYLSIMVMFCLCSRSTVAASLSRLQSKWTCLIISTPCYEFPGILLFLLTSVAIWIYSIIKYVLIFLLLFMWLALCQTSTPPPPLSHSNSYKPGTSCQHMVHCKATRAMVIWSLVLQVFLWAYLCSW